MFSPCHQHNLLHPSQYGARPGHRPHDHIYLLQAHTHFHQSAYHLYIDFNKAFNSVPLPALWCLLHHLAFPHQLISTLQSFYAAARDFPLIRNNTYSSLHPARGLRQGCPLSPLLFCLYLNCLLFNIPQRNLTIHSFIDDILLRANHPLPIYEAYTFIQTTGRLLGFDLNNAKTELHTMQNTQTPPAAPHPLQTPTTIAQTANSGYNYLGVFIPDTATYDPVPTFQQLISSFFEKLLAIPLTPSEVIHLHNIRLIPALLYKLAGHSLQWPALNNLQAFLWRTLAKAAGIPIFISPKDRFMPRKLGGLNVRSIIATFAMQTINHAQRYLHLKAPSPTTSPIRALLLSSVPSPLLNNLTDACYFLNLRYHSHGPWNPCLTHQLTTFDQPYVQLHQGQWIQCKVNSPGNPASLQELSSPYTYNVTNRHNFILHNPTITSAPLIQRLTTRTPRHYPQHQIPHHSLPYKSPFSTAHPTPHLPFQ